MITMQVPTLCDAVCGRAFERLSSILAERRPHQLYLLRALGAELLVMFEPLEQPRLTDRLLEPGPEQRHETIAVELFVAGELQRRSSRVDSLVGGFLTAAWFSACPDAVDHSRRLKDGGGPCFNVPHGARQCRLQE